MTHFVERLLAQAQRTPDAVCVVDIPSAQDTGGRRLTYAQVLNHARQLGQHMNRQFTDEKRTIGIVMRNSSDWVIADVACLLFGFTSLPLPLGFSKYQAEHLAFECSGFLVDDKGLETLEKRWEIDLNASRLVHVPSALQTPIPVPASPSFIDSADAEWICKVIHTSGTTSKPKGVKQSLDGLSAVLQSLLGVVPAAFQKRYLSVVPLSLLIEQVTAVYLPLLSGGTVYFLDEHTPLIGEAGYTTSAILAQLLKTRASAVTVPPMMLDVFLEVAEQNTDPELLSLLRNELYITAGGAPISSEKLQRLSAQGIEVHQGYGLSENGSVVSVNTPTHSKLGSVGKPLPHVQVRVTDQQRVEIKSTSMFRGYSWVDPSACSFTEDGWLRTGDIGEFDDEGFLFITGREKNIICLPNGRNVSPEQIELEFKEQTGVNDALMFMTADGQLAIVLSVGPQFNHPHTQDWAQQRFSEVELPQTIWPLAPDAPQLQSLYTLNGPARRAHATDLHRQTCTH